MRDIKFRFWRYGRMLQAHQLYAYTDNNFAGDGEVLMQFTGLRDRNGKEIYEGDIVRVDDSVCGNPIDGYKDGVYKVEYCLPDCAFVLAQLDEKSATSFNEVMEYEIIGNLYENPELLNQKA